MDAEPSALGVRVFTPHPVVKVSVAEFSALQPHLDLARALLSDAEKVRYHAYAFAADAVRFALGRLFLRWAIVEQERPGTAAFNEALAAVTFSERANAAPLAVLDGAGYSSVFSLSRSATKTVVGVGAVTALGVDVEDNTQAKHLTPAMVKQFFPEFEQVVFSQEADKGRADRLLASWTGKEAIVKAAGVGLRVPLQAITLHGETVVAMPDMLGAKDRCSLRLFTLSGSSLAVAWW